MRRSRWEFSSGRLHIGGVIITNGKLFGKCTSTPILPWADSHDGYIPMMYPPRSNTLTGFTDPQCLFASVCKFHRGIRLLPLSSLSSCTIRTLCYDVYLPMLPLPALPYIWHPPQISHGFHSRKKNHLQIAEHRLEKGIRHRSHGRFSARPVTIKCRISANRPSFSIRLCLKTRWRRRWLMLYVSAVFREGATPREKLTHLKI